MWKIENIEIENKVVLAPMAGVCNVAFRTLAKSFGVGLIYAEMVSDNAVNYKNKKTLKMLEVDPLEHPMSMQIFGGDVETILEAALYVEAHCESDIIDINMGCPVPKVTKIEAGSAILKDTDKVYEIMSTLTKHLKKPVTAKMRAGWDHNSINAVENAKALTAGGAKAIAVHPRTTKQLYTGLSDWSIIKEVKEAITTIPIIGNGDIKTPIDAKRMLDETGCDAVMIGRAALGNPWILKDTVAYLETGILPTPPTPIEKLEIARLHLDKLVALKGDRVATLEMRSHAAWYIKGIKGNHFVKERINTCQTPQDFYYLFEEYTNYLKARIYHD